MLLESDYVNLKNNVIGLSFPKPQAGTLSGHAAGEPFTQLVYDALKKLYPKQTYKQYEYLNDLYLKNPRIISYQERLNLLESPTILFLLSRGKEATTQWSPEHLFSEKQNDTADILIVFPDFYQIIDVKTRNIEKKAQPPNIISAYKLAQLCACMIDNNEFEKLAITYIEIAWTLEQNFCVCKDFQVVQLFQILPEELYINWAAALQVQFHVSEITQHTTGFYSQETWAKAYLKHFVGEAQKRAEKMIEKFVKPFEKYL